MSTQDNRFAKLNVKLWQNPKTLKFITEHSHAFSIWILALTYCTDNLSNGIFEKFIAERFFGATQDDFKALVEANYIEEENTGIYRIHDYEKYQSTHEEVLSMRDKLSEAGRRGAAVRWGKKNREISQSETGKSEAPQHSLPHEKNDSTPYSTPLGFDSPTMADKDKDKDKEYIKENIIKEKNQLQTETDNAAYERSQSTLIAHPKHQPEAYDQLTARLKAIYPAERFDLQTTRNQTLLEAYWFKVEDHAAQYGKNPFDWLVEQTQAYLKVTERRYVQRFSKYFMSETYAQDWKNAMPQLSRSQENLNRNIAFINSMSDKPMENTDIAREITA